MWFQLALVFAIWDISVVVKTSSFDSKWKLRLEKGWVQVKTESTCYWVHNNDQDHIVMVLVLVLVPVSWLRLCPFLVSVLYWTRPLTLYELLTLLVSTMMWDRHKLCGFLVYYNFNIWLTQTNYKAYKTYCTAQSKIILWGKSIMAISLFSF